VAQNRKKEKMEHELITVKEGRRIIRYVYRGVWVERFGDAMLHYLNRYDRNTVTIETRTIKDACAKIDKSLDTNGRTFGGRLVVAYVRDNQIETALASPDYRHPNARLIGETAQPFTTDRG
jgi:hypothetical protein